MTRLRVLTLNIWQEQGPWRERLAVIEENLRQLSPDVVCLQEVREVPGRMPNQARRLANALGLHCVYECAQPWGGGEEGLALLSKSPLHDSRVRELPSQANRSRRICLGATLQLRADRVHLYTTHLAYRLQDGLLREAQVREVDRFVRDTAEDALAILCGDFNATPESDEIRFLCGLTTLESRRTLYQDAYALSNPGNPGHTWAAKNPYTRALDWYPRRRLDYIFVSPERRGGAGRVEACRIACDKPDRRGIYCSDHYAVVADIRLLNDSQDAPGP